MEITLIMNRVENSSRNYPTEGVKNLTRNYFVIVKGLSIFDESVPRKAKSQQTELYT
jgi:hypothetical protein